MEKMWGIRRVYSITLCQIMIVAFIRAFHPFFTFAAICMLIYSQRLLLWKCLIFLYSDIFFFNNFCDLQTIMSIFQKVDDFWHYNRFLLVNNLICVFWVMRIFACLHQMSNIIIWRHFLIKAACSTSWWFCWRV
jgi:hypothetical protein